MSTAQVLESDINKFSSVINTSPAILISPNEKKSVKSVVKDPFKTEYWNHEGCTG